MSLTPSRRPAPGQRRCSVGGVTGGGGGGGRRPHSDASGIPGRARPADGSLAARTHPSTPRRQATPPACGVRPPAPEQYLTPLQQKEVCIRHLRARLRDNVERLQHRDSEIDELRARLYRMQEDWIEEECHRVEAQLALKEARKEIRHLQEVFEVGGSNRSAREPAGTPYPGRRGSHPVGRSRSCGCSPAGTLSRGAAASEASRAPRPAGQTHLLLEAALLSEQLPQQGLLQGGAPPVPRSSAYERLCSGGAVLPMSHSCQTLSSTCRCGGPAYLPHHHLFLHLPQEEAPVTLAAAAAAERKPEVRSRACSPTMAWLSEEAEQLNAIAAPAAGSTPPASFPVFSAPEHSYSFPPSPYDPEETPHTRQPRPTAPPPMAATEEDTPQVCHWSRYFLVDLLALAMPAVPTVAWLCRGAPREAAPVCHIGSLLRGCCAVALHSLRRRGGRQGPPK
ncbi:syntaphilin [Brachionichthys hirsutus]|uniref:syntaphilin n=1 Tax=Brachionichthys hirsutus TaxID=412623 RepID=UPI0036049549